MFFSIFKKNAFSINSRFVSQKMHELKKKDISDCNVFKLQRFSKVFPNVDGTTLNSTELNKVLKKLKTGKCKDPDNFIYDLFKDGVIGSDLRKSILMLVNNMKSQMKIPSDLKSANITIIHKKGNKVDLNNWRGIFVTSVVRGILMKLIYERTYQTIDNNMYDRWTNRS